jgi:hypothetical protein
MRELRDSVGRTRPATWRRQWPWRKLPRVESQPDHGRDLGGVSGPGGRRLRLCVVDEEGDTVDERGIALSSALSGTEFSSRPVGPHTHLSFPGG